MITIAICGCGSRGLYAYTQYQKQFPDKMKVVAGADIRPERLALLREIYGVPENMCFDSDIELLRQPRLADAMLIATMDRQHVDEAIAALDKGYHLILEKPISPELSECLRLYDKVQETDRFIAVGHVLRYSDFYVAIKELIDGGKLGKVRTINMTENVGYWHQAHSFVRGNWRNSVESSPMILQKSCHDMDMMRWLAGSRCLRVQSFGSLDYFTAEHAPEGSAERCLECPYHESCRYSAERIYILDERTGVRKNGDSWPANVVVPEPTEEKLREELKTSPYGRCVFRCDNDVVDHQIVNCEFEGQIYGAFTMCAFTTANYRTIKITGTEGELTGDLDEMKLYLTPLGGETECIDLMAEEEEFTGHGGGDEGLSKEFCELLEGEIQTAKTSVEESIESHVMALAAEESRLYGGVTIELDTFMKGERDVKLSD